MTAAALAIDGRLVTGETLQAQGFGGPASSLQWQALVNGVWTNVGTHGSATYVIPSNAAGWAYRLMGASSDGTTIYSTATGVVTVDTKKSTAPVLGGANALAALLSEGPDPHPVFGFVTFSDADRGNYAGASLLLQDTTSTIYGGDGHDTLAIRFLGTAAGQFSYNAATHEVKYAFTTGTATTIGTLDATLNGNGTDLKVVFNSNATQAAVDALIDNLQYTNNDDSPTPDRLLTLRITDPSGASAQRAIASHIEPTPDAPVFTSAAAFAIDEDQTAVGVVAAIDPDREAGTNQGIAYSLVAGEGSTDNALFAVEAATGALHFVAAPDYEGAHAPTYSLRMRASDSNGGSVEQVIAVTVRDVNNEPVASDLHASVSEDGPSILIAANVSDPTPGDQLSYAIDTTSTLGAVSIEGGSFRYDPNGAFEMLKAGATFEDHFQYTATDLAGHAVTRTVTVAVQGVNDAPVAISPIGIVTEAGTSGSGMPVATGGITVFDPDGDAATFSTNGTGTYGSLVVTSNGNWTYTLDNDAAAVQALRGFEMVTDTIDVNVSDGQGAVVTHPIQVIVYGANDAAEFNGTTTLVAMEDSFDAQGHLVLAADLGVHDPDGDDTVHPYTGTGSSQLGTFAVAANGQWTWTSQASTWAIESLGEGQTLTDTIGVSTDDGSFTLVNVVVTGQNDAPVIAMGDTTGQVVEPGGFPPELPPPPTTVTGSLMAWDKDNGDAIAWSGSAEGQYGNFTIDAAGHWTYVVDAVKSDPLVMGQSALDTFTATVSDGHGGSASQAITITVYGGNETPVVDSTSTLTGTVHELPAPDGTLVIDLADGSSSPGVVAVDADGGLLVLADIEQFPGYSMRALSRFNADGSLDTSYGQNGHTTFQWPVTTNELQVDAQGRAVAVGYTAYNYSGTAVDIAVARVLPDGSLDTSFGTNGVVTLDIAGGYDYGRQLFIRPDGEMLVTFSGGGANSTNPVAVLLHGDGSIDTSFGIGGFLNLPSSPYARELLVDAQGRITVWSMEADAQTGAPEVHLLRFLADGSADASFGNGNGVDVSLSSSSWGVNVAVAGDGHILLASTEPGDGLQHQHTVLTSLHADGTVDETFGLGGSVDTQIWAAPDALQFDAQGRILLAGQAANDLGNPTDFVVARYLQDGSADMSFGNGGSTVTDASGVGLNDYVMQLVLNADGSIVLAGATSEQQYGWDTAIARYTADGKLDPSFGVGIEPTVTGMINATDPDPKPGSWETLNFTVVNQGTYGDFELLSPNWGYWSYTLDSTRAVTAALDEGQTAVDTITVAIRDGFGGVTYQDVAITIVGSYDPPAG